MPFLIRSRFLPALLSALAMTGCATIGVQNNEPESAATEVRLTPYPYNSDVHGNDLPVQIGRFDVPARRNGSSTGAPMEVGFVRYPAMEGVDGPPIVFLSIEERPSLRRQELYAALRGAGDVVIFNRRGYGFSSPPPPCPGRVSYPFEEPLVRHDLAAALRSYASQCFAQMQRSGTDVKAYAEDEIAGDLADLARALEADRISLIVEGRMAVPAAAAMQRHPALVQNAVFVNPRMEDGSGDLSALSTAFGAVMADQTRPLAEIVAALQRKLADAPLAINVSSRSGRQIPLKVGELDYALMVADAVARDARSRSRLISATESALAGDASELGYMALELRMRLGQPQPMKLIEGLDGGKRPKEHASTLAGFAMRWPASALEPSQSASARQPQSEGDVITTRTLIVRGTLDPFVGMTESRAFAKRFEDPQLLTVEKGTPGLLDNTAAIATVLGRFLTGADVRLAVIEADDL